MDASRALSAVVPRFLRGYQARWLGADVLAGLTLSAVAIPEVMGYTAITHTPIVTGLYTLLLPLIVFAVFGSSKLLVVGGDSATAAVLAGGLATAGLLGASPGSTRWVALCALTAFVTGVLLLVARLLRLGFLGDFLSAPVLIGFLSGVGIQVATDQIPALLGVARGSGNWLEGQWAWISQLGRVSVPTLAYGLATVAIIVVSKRWVPRIPGTVVAVAGLLVVASVSRASGYGVDVVGTVNGGIPPLALPDGLSLSDMGAVSVTALACVFIIITQSAATARSFAMKAGDHADVNRDIVGLAAANLAAGLTGTFVVNGSPTKTQIVDDARAHTQLANLVVAGVTLVVLVFVTGLLAELPHAVLAGVVFVIGIGLVDGHGLRSIWRRRPSEFVVAVVTALCVVVWGVGVAIVVAIVLSLITVIVRQYNAPSFVLTKRNEGGYDYHRAVAGTQSASGLIVFRFDSQLFFANATMFCARAETVVVNAPDPVRWFILDCAGIPDIDYSAGRTLGDLVRFLHARSIHVILARPEPALLATLDRYGLMAEIRPESIFSDLDAAVAAFTASPRSRSGGAPGPREG